MSHYAGCRSDTVPSSWRLPPASPEDFARAFTYWSGGSQPNNNAACLTWLNANAAGRVRWFGTTALNATTVLCLGGSDVAYIETAVSPDCCQDCTLHDAVPSRLTDESRTWVCRPTMLHHVLLLCVYRSLLAACRAMPPTVDALPRAQGTRLLHVVALQVRA